MFHRLMTDPTPERPVGDVTLPEEMIGSPIEFFELRMRLDTTLTVNGDNWMKPGIEGAVRWKRLPTEDELKDATAYIQFAVIDPAIQQMIGLLSEQLAEARRRK
jgi:hypothetical protein